VVDNEKDLLSVLESHNCLTWLNCSWCWQQLTKLSFILINYRLSQTCLAFLSAVTIFCLRQYMQKCASI